MSKPSEIQQAYNELTKCINGMAKGVVGLRVTDMVAIKGMTDAVISLKKELATVQQENASLKQSLKDAAKRNNVLMNTKSKEIVLINALKGMHTMNLKMVREHNNRVPPWESMDEEHLHDVAVILERFSE
jgi:hypothetical protein